jgi:hypothetical protein
MFINTHITLIRTNDLAYPMLAKVVQDLNGSVDF